MSLEGRQILVTGSAGFIGSALVKQLLDSNAYVIGIDNLNTYYSRDLKLDRLKKIEEKVTQSKGKWKFFKVSLEDSKALKLISLKYDFDIIVHLAAQVGVRYSLENPESYINSNLVGFGNILELCKNKKIKNFIFASSSSVYGNNEEMPFTESQNVDYPISLYAATKKSNELMAYSYSHLYQIPTTGLRFFTVYGPWGRPDMAPMIFAKSILERNAIKVFNKGKMRRDFTYIDDVIEGIYRCCKKPAAYKKNLGNSSNKAPFRIFNIGNGKPVELMDFIQILEDTFGIKSKKEFVEMQKGDVASTWADTSGLEEWIGYSPNTSIEVGLDNLAKWYKDYYGF